MATKCYTVLCLQLTLWFEIFRDNFGHILGPGGYCVVRLLSLGEIIQFHFHCTKTLGEGGVSKQIKLLVLAGIAKREEFTPKIPGVCGEPPRGVATNPRRRRGDPPAVMRRSPAVLRRLPDVFATTPEAGVTTTLRRFVATLLRPAGRLVTTRQGVCDYPLGGFVTTRRGVCDDPPGGFVTTLPGFVTTLPGAENPPRPTKTINTPPS